MRDNKLPKIKESSIKKQIAEYLDICGIFFWRPLQGLGCRPGIPDICGTLPGGQSLYIEVKTATGKLSVHQENFLDNAKRHGALAFVARCLEDVVETLDKHRMVTYPKNTRSFIRDVAEDLRGEIPHNCQRKTCGKIGKRRDEGGRWWCRDHFPFPKPPVEKKEEDDDYLLKF